MAFDAALKYNELINDRLDSIGKLAKEVILLKAKMLKEIGKK